MRVESASPFWAMVQRIGENGDVAKVRRTLPDVFVVIDDEDGHERDGIDAALSNLQV